MADRPWDSPNVTICYDFKVRPPTAPDTCDGLITIIGYLNVTKTISIDPGLDVHLSRKLLAQKFTHDFEVEEVPVEDVDCCGDDREIEKFRAQNVPFHFHKFNHDNPEVMVHCDDHNTDSCISGSLKFKWRSSLLSASFDGDLGMPMGNPLHISGGVDETKYELKVDWQLCAFPEGQRPNDTSVSRTVTVTTSTSTPYSEAEDGAAVFNDGKTVHPESSNHWLINRESQKTPTQGGGGSVEKK